MRTRAKIFTTVAFALLVVGCDTDKDTPTEKPVTVAKTEPEATPDPDEKPEPDPRPEPEPEPEPNATASIASVQIIEDCPGEDPKPAAKPTADEPPPPPATEPEPPARHTRRAHGSSAKGRGPGPRSRCTQSTMQIAFASMDRGDAKIAVTKVRLLSPDVEAPLAELDPRLPMRWAEDGTYTPWDEIVVRGDDLKAQYRLSVPDWSQVEVAIGGPSYGAAFVLEVDIEIDGETTTLRSPQFNRERPHVVVT